MNFKQYYQYEATNYVNNVAHKDILDALHHIYLNYAKTGKTIVCTYTSVNKVGINPSSNYTTPIGIYFYEIEYLISTGANPPFAGYKSHLNVCEVIKPVTHMKPLPAVDARNHANSGEYGSRFMMNNLRLATTIADKDNIIMTSLRGQKGWEKIRNITTNDQWYDTLPKAIWYNSMPMKSDYSFVWLATASLSNNNTVKWGKMLKDIGYNGFIDEGSGTIHSNESYQGVVFDKSSLKVIQTLDNKKNRNIHMSRWSLPVDDRSYLYKKFNVELRQLLPMKNIVNNNTPLNSKFAVKEWEDAANQIIDKFLEFGSFWIKEHSDDNFVSDNKSPRIVQGRINDFITNVARAVESISNNKYKKLYEILLVFLRNLTSLTKKDYQKYEPNLPITQYDKLSKIIDRSRNYIKVVTRTYGHDEDLDLSAKYRKQSSKYPEKLRR